MSWGRVREYMSQGDVFWAIRSALNCGEADRGMMGVYIANEYLRGKEGKYDSFIENLNKFASTPTFPESLAKEVEAKLHQGYESVLAETHPDLYSSINLWADKYSAKKLYLQTIDWKTDYWYGNPPPGVSIHKVRNRKWAFYKPYFKLFKLYDQYFLFLKEETQTKLILDCGEKEILRSWHDGVMRGGSMEEEILIAIRKNALERSLKRMQEELSQEDILSEFERSNIMKADKRPSSLKISSEGEISFDDQQEFKRWILGL